MVERLDAFWSKSGNKSTAAAEARARADDWEGDGNGSTIYLVGTEGVLEAMVQVADFPRAEAVEVIRQLKACGVRSVMCTGDNAQVAEAVRRVVGLGLDDVRSGLRPEDKVTVVASLKSAAGSASKSAVAMLGDGVNDAPALVTADVGVAIMGAGGTAVAMETADVTLMDSDHRKFVKAIRLGRQCVAVIRQNVAISLVSKVAVISLAVLGLASLWAAIVTDIGSMLLVTLNSLRCLGPRAPRRFQTRAEETPKRRRRGNRGYERRGYRRAKEWSTDEPMTSELMVYDSAGSISDAAI